MHYTSNQQFTLYTHANFEDTTFYNQNIELLHQTLMVPHTG